MPVVEDGQKAILRPSMSKWFYIAPLIVLLLNGTVILLLFIRNKPINVFSLIYLLISIPLSLMSLVVFLVKLVKDKKKIKNKLKPIFTKNFIKANFRTHNKRKYSEIVSINEDGITFDLGKCTYIIDKEAIYFDEKNYPNSDYFPEIPNPILLSRKDVIEKVIEAVKQGKAVSLKDTKGEIIDISFSSENLQLFKQHKIFSELNKNPDMDSATKFSFGMNIFLMVIVLVLAILMYTK